MANVNLEICSKCYWLDTRYGVTLLGNKYYHCDKAKMDEYEIAMFKVVDDVKLKLIKTYEVPSECPYELEHIIKGESKGEKYE